MRLYFMLLLVMIIPSACTGQIPNKAAQIDMAVQAAPEEQRAAATVMGYDSNGKLVKIKEGSNELICLSDDPEKEGFSVACYHKDLEPFMARGRELRTQGKSNADVFKIRESEARAGKLKMPENPTTLHVISGTDGKYDPATKQIINAKLRYVVYIPFATVESTGLPLKPMVPGGPWLMDPGTHKAHIMISPVSE